MFQFSAIALTIFLLDYCYAIPKPIITQQDSNTITSLIPYVVGIEQNNENICGGTLIKTAVVLTAAHCLVGKEEDSLTIRAGSLYVNRGGETRGVRTSVYHKRYNKRYEIDFNVCVLQLDKPYTLGSTYMGFNNIATIDIATEYPPPEIIARFTGWGRYSPQGRWTSGMSSVNIQLANDTYCRRLTDYELGMDPKICAGGKEGATDGDAGGPLVYNAQQIGLATGGIKFKPNEYPPQIYTNVVFLRKWIGKYANRFQRYFQRNLPYEDFEYSK